MHKKRAWRLAPRISGLAYFGAAALVLAAPRAAGAAQPELAWSTYYGGTSNEFVNDVAVDAAGNIYVVGRTFSATGIAAGGVHDGTINGETDAFLVKLDPAGKRLWGFYYGGTATDNGMAVAVRDDQLVIGGQTTSSGGIATPGTFQPKLGGTINGFIALFTTSGQQVWGTYVGGAAGTAVNSLAFDDTGRVYACGSSAPNANFASGASHQPTHAGLGDGFLLLLDTGGQLVWGTYYGGTGSDRCDNIHHRPGVGVFFSGETTSTTGIGTFGVKGSGSEGFIARFYTNGIRDWGRYLGGGSEEYTVTTKLHPNGGLALIMSTRSGMLSTDGSVVSGNYDTLIARIADDGALTWATYFGGTADDLAGGLAVGPDGQIYALAVTYSKNLATPGAYQSALLSGQDGVMLQLSPAGVHGWSSYFGGNHEDSVTAGVYGGGLSIVGNTKSTTNVAALVAHQLTLGGGQDGFIAKFFTQPLPQPDGTPCADVATCQSGLCVDGVCCDATCGDGSPNDCQACSTAEGAAVDGTCGPKAKNAECRPAMGVCDAAESCDGVALACPPDKPAPDGTDCPDGECSAGVCAPPEPSTSTTDPSAGTTTDPSDATTDPSRATTGSDVTSAGTTSAATSGGETQTTAATGGPGDTSNATTLTDGDTSASTAPPTEGGGPIDPGETTGYTSLTGFSSTGAPQDGDGCGCTSTPTSGLAGLLLALLARRRRR